MRIKIAVTTLLLLTLSFVHAPLSAQRSTHARLELRVVDQMNAPLTQAVITAYTLDGRPGVTVRTDARGNAVMPDVATGMTQIVAKSIGFSPSIGKVTLLAGDNTRTITLRAAGES